MQKQKLELPNILAQKKKDVLANNYITMIFLHILLFIFLLEKSQQIQTNGVMV